MIPATSWAGRCVRSSGCLSARGPRGLPRSSRSAPGWESSPSLATLNAAAVGVPVPDPYSLGFGGLSLLVGRKMWRAAGREGSLDLPEETGRFYRVALMASLATALVAIGGFAAVLLVAAVKAVMKGHMAIAASIVLILVAVALRRGRLPS
jgi:hypothetical protein